MLRHTDKQELPCFVPIQPPVWTKFLQYANLKTLEGILTSPEEFYNLLKEAASVDLSSTEIEDECSNDEIREMWASVNSRDPVRDEHVI